MKTKTIVCEDCRGTGIREDTEHRCGLCGGKGEREYVCYLWVLRDARMTQLDRLRNEFLIARLGEGFRR